MRCHLQDEQEFLRQIEKVSRSQDATMIAQKWN